MSHAMGGVGTLCVLLAYFLVSTGRVKSASYTFQGFNVLGAGLLLAYSVILGAWAALVLNIVWVGIGSIALIQIGWRRTRDQR